MTPPPTSQNPAEFSRLLGIYNRRYPLRTLEIGTHEGGTLYYWLKHASPGSIVGSIDDQGIISTKVAREWASFDVKAICRHGFSEKEDVIKWAEENIAPIDFLFIDGGHSYEQVSSDWKNYLPLMNKNSIVAFHDILPHNPYEGQPCEVDLLWQQIKNQYRYEEIVEKHPEWLLGPGIGVLYL